MVDRNSHRTVSCSPRTRLGCNSRVLAVSIIYPSAPLVPILGRFALDQDDLLPFL